MVETNSMTLFSVFLQSIDIKSANFQRNSFLKALAKPLHAVSLYLPVKHVGCRSEDQNQRHE